VAGSGLLAGGLAYRFFLWLVPFGSVLAAIASFWADSDPEGVEEAAKSLGLAGAAARTARTTFEEESTSRWYLLAFGAVLLVWFGMGAVRALRVAYQIAWAEQAPKLRRPIHASLTFLGFVLAGAAAGVGIRGLRDGTAPAVWILLTALMFGAFLALALGAMHLLPHGGADWRGLLPGALLAAAGMQLMHLFVVVYLAPKLTRSSELYGALGGATVVLLWLYVTARLLVSAAFLNATLWERRHRYA
jgi:uncharacterized BrkB/YihY/UPF0761 family membrane protein